MRGRARKISKYNGGGVFEPDLGWVDGQTNLKIIVTLFLSNVTGRDNLAQFDNYYQRYYIHPKIL